MGFAVILCKMVETGPVSTVSRGCYREAEVVAELHAFRCVLLAGLPS